jgi:hypothetical protein
MAAALPLGCGEPTLPPFELPVDIEALCGAPPAGELSPWLSCSDETLTRLIATADGRAWIQFRRSIDARATVAWLKDRGIEVTRSDVSYARVVLEPRLSLIAEVRRHDNVRSVGASLGGFRFAI